MLFQKIGIFISKSYSAFMHEKSSKCKNGSGSTHTPLENDILPVMLNILEFAHVCIHNI